MSPVCVKGLELAQVLSKTTQGFPSLAGELFVLPFLQSKGRTESTPLDSTPDFQEHTWHRWLQIWFPIQLWQLLVAGKVAQPSIPGKQSSTLGTSNIQNIAWLQTLLPSRGGESSNVLYGLVAMPALGWSASAAIVGCTTADYGVLVWEAADWRKLQS